jgi:hypothetical protein
MWSIAMGIEPDFGALVEEVRLARNSLDAGDARTNKRIGEITKSVDELFRRLGRPGMMERADEGNVSDDYAPSSQEIDEALAARRGFKALLRHGDTSRLEPTLSAPDRQAGKALIQNA